jgi:hypothetical protein
MCKHITKNCSCMQSIWDEKQLWFQKLEYEYLGKASSKIVWDILFAIYHRALLVCCKWNNRPICCVFFKKFK